MRMGPRRCVPVERTSIVLIPRRINSAHGCRMPRATAFCKRDSIHTGSCMAGRDGRNVIIASTFASDDRLPHLVHPGRNVFVWRVLHRVSCIRFRLCSNGWTCKCVSGAVIFRPCSEADDRRVGMLGLSKEQVAVDRDDTRFGTR